jgi:hypothetical protein
MLGAHRPSVTNTAGELQSSGLIAYRHGKVDILDRAGLEKAVCECYGLIRELYHETFKQVPVVVQKIESLR